MNSAPHAAGDHLVALESGGLRRQYLLHVPPGPVEPRPLVLFFHGTGGTVRWTQDEAKFGTFADRVGIVAVYPQGLPPDPSAPYKFLANPPAWNDGGPTRPGRPVYDDVGFIAALLDDVLQRTSIDSTRIYATGFSNGASMTFHLAATLGERLAAIAPVAGYCRSERAKPVPTLYVIGADDPLVPPGGGPAFSPWLDRAIDRPSMREQLARWAEWMGCEPTPELLLITDGDHRERYPGPVTFESLTIAGLGHHWPGGRGQLKKKLAGQPSDRIDGNAVIWEFLRQHRRA